MIYCFLSYSLGGGGNPQGVSIEAGAVLSCPFVFMRTRNASERLSADVLTSIVPNHSLSSGNCPSMRSRAGKVKT